MGFAMRRIGIIERYKGRLESSRNALVRARELLIVTGNTEAQGFLEFDFGRLSLIQGQHEKALDHFLQALSMFRKFDIWDDETACALESIGALAMEQGHLSESVWLLASAAAWRRMRHFAISVLDRRKVEETLGVLKSRLGNDTFKAQWLIGESMSFDEAISIPYSIKIKPRSRSRSGAAHYRRTSNACRLESVRSFVSLRKVGETVRSQTNLGFPPGQ
jgi:tetratricopeptide (TPR) repeat protein